MRSSDTEILLEINGRLERIEHRLDSLDERVTRLEAQTLVTEQNISVLHDTLLVQGAKLDMLLWAFGIGFAVLAFIAAVVPVWLREKPGASSHPSLLSFSEIREMIVWEITRYHAKKEE